MYRFTTVAIAVLTLGASHAHAASLRVVDCTSGPYTTIQSAIDASFPGDTVVVKPCTYSEVLTVTSTSDLSIVGAEQGSIFGARALGVGANGDSPVVVDGGPFFAPCVSITGSDRVKLSGIRFNNCSVGDPAIWIDNSDDVEIMGNRMNLSGFSNVEVYNSDRPRIIGNVFVDAYWWGVYIASNVDDATIADNRIGGPAAGIYVDGGVGHHLSNNQVTGTFIYAISLWGGTGTRVQHNTVTGNFGSGITVQAGSTDAVVVGNKSQGNIFDYGSGTLLAENN